MNYNLSTLQRAEIVILFNQNVSLREISRRMMISRNTVKLWARRYQETGAIEPEKRGRKPVAYTDASEMHRDIVERHMNDPFLSTRSTAIRHNVTLRTVRTHLKASGLGNYRPARKILLSENHKQNRVLFAQEYLNFDWSNNVVIFTDEKTFKSDKDGRKILWRKKGERYKVANILPVRSSGRITLGYWGWISSGGPGELVEVGGNNNSAGYLDILKNVMLPSVRTVYPDSHIYFVHDNCSVHRAEVVRTWLSVQENFTVIEFPPKSPDLNPIENLWGQMVLNWDPSEVRTRSNLNDLVLSTWEMMRGSELCWNLVDSMKTRLQLVIDSNGAPIRY